MSELEVEIFRWEKGHAFKIYAGVYTVDDLNALEQMIAEVKGAIAVEKPRPANSLVSERKDA